MNTDRVPDSLTTKMGAVYQFPQGPYISIEGQPYPFLIERVDEHGVFVSECRPYHISSCGYLRPNTTLRVLRKPKQIEQARWYLWRGVCRGVNLSEVQYAAAKGA